MTVSHWRRHPAPGAPVVECDAVVVGAGICGVSAALHLERRGLDVRIVDRCSLGAGASSRNAGFLMRGAAENYALAVKDYGRERAKFLWRLTEENLAALRALGIDQLPSYRAKPSALLALEPTELAELHDSLPLLAADGFRVEWLDRHDDSAWVSGRCLGALINPDDAQVNPYEMLQLLASRLKRPIADHAEVEGFSEAPALRGSPRVDVFTPHAKFRARWCFVCTNAYAPIMFSNLETWIVPRRGQMLAIPHRPPGDAAAKLLRLDFSYYANRGSEYFRQTPDGTVVLGGCRTQHADREIGYDDRTTPWVQADLESFAESLFGGSLPRRPDGRLFTSAKWSGVMGFTPDGLPLIGSLDLAPRIPPDTVWFVGGCTGHGMSMFHRVAELAVSTVVEGVSNQFRVLAGWHWPTALGTSRRSGTLRPESRIPPLSCPEHPRLPAWRHVGGHHPWPRSPRNSENRKERRSMSRKETVLMLVGGVVIGATYALFQIAGGAPSDMHAESRVIFAATRPVAKHAGSPVMASPKSNLDAAMSLPMEDWAPVADGPVMARAIAVQ